MTRVILSKNWKRKGANLPKNVKIAKAKAKKRYAPVPSYEVTKK